MAKRKSKKVTKPEEVLEAKEPVIIETGPKQVRFENRMPKRNIFLAESYRDERDTTALNDKIRVIGKQNFKRNVLCVTTIKHMVVDEQGDWVTEFIIDMKG